MAEDEKKTTTDTENSDQSVAESEVDHQRQEADFALKLVDTLVGFNEQNISSYEIPKHFCLFDVKLLEGRQAYQFKGD